MPRWRHLGLVRHSHPPRWDPFIRECENIFFKKGRQLSLTLPLEFVLLQAVPIRLGHGDRGQLLASSVGIGNREPDKAPKCTFCKQIPIVENAAFLGVHLIYQSARHILL